MGAGDLIRAERKIKKLTQKQLGELCGIAEPTIRRYELGKLNPKYETLQRIAKALDVPVWRLLPAADQEPDRDYELVCDTLADADLCLEAELCQDTDDKDSWIYYVWHKDAEEPEEDRVEYAFRDLLRIVKDTHKWADANRFEYMRKRLEIELF